MRKLILAVAVVALASSAMADTGWLDSYVYMWDSVSTMDTWYDIVGTIQAKPFHGADLGTFQPTADLYMNSQINVSANGGDTYNYVSLNWRIGTSGDFTDEVDVSLESQGGDNWRGVTSGLNLIDAVGGAYGTYQVQVYLERQHTWGGTTTYTTGWDRDGDTGGGAADNFFQAEFTIIPEPTTLALVGLGIAGLLAYRRRR